MSFNLNYLADYEFAIFDVVVQLPVNSKESLRFNQEKSCRMYMRRILERESLLFYKIGARIEESDCPEEAKEEIRNHLELLEELFVTDVSKPRERIVFLRGDKLTEWTDLSVEEQLRVWRFVIVQYNSVRRLREHFGRERYLVPGYYRWTESPSCLLEMGNILWETKIVVANGGVNTKKAFLNYLCLFYDVSFPSNYNRELYRMENRENPHKFWSETSDKYLQWIQQRLGESEEE
ncbi:hypothetical protein [Butyricimonas hominis]|jgi:hypothetical protein|uniref:Uncharacterized protein n=1 Tax=Butyricimonas hominis TaxID=2763032 RepID=A0ABR7CXG3_9BACT|nr:hypothetical protein [Butyricimonas hominis]MBC5620372.1 hypothetical protein [Butyricimonas hominis]